MQAVRAPATLEPLRDQRGDQPEFSFGQRSGALHTPWEPRPTKRESSFQATRPRTPLRSTRPIGMACTSRQQTLRNNVGEVFFPHAVRFDVPLGLNSRPPGSPGTATEGRRRRVAHVQRLESGWTSPRKIAEGRRVTLSARGASSGSRADVSVAQTNSSAHTGAVTLRLSDDEKHNRELEQIFQVIRNQIHKKRTLYGKEVYNARSLFKQADRGSTGTISKDEFSQALLRLGVGLTKEQMRMVSDFIDTDNDDCVDYGEFTLHLVVGDEELEEEEARRRKVSIARLRAIAWEVRAKVVADRTKKSPAVQKEIHVSEMKHYKKKLEHTLSRIEATNERKGEAASLKRHAAVLGHDGDFGGALATLARAKALTPRDPSIEIQEKQLRAKMQEPPPVTADSTAQLFDSECKGSSE